MSVAIRPFAKGKGWEVDIRTVLPCGEPYRERRKAPVSSKSAAWRWGLAREREIVQHGPRRPKRKKEVPQPTFSEFADQFIKDRAATKKYKPSYLAAQRSILRVHLRPRFGSRKLNAITKQDIQRLEADLVGTRERKTVNNVLAVLKSILGEAVDASVITEIPCPIKVQRVAPGIDISFHEVEDLERLVEAAQDLDWRAHLAVLLGAEAGLRCGELLGLEWNDIDFRRGHLLVRRSIWRGHETVPKGGRPRRLPLTKRLVAALREHRHIRGPWVLCRDDGRQLTEKILRVWVQKASRRAGVAHHGLHVLRHTFASHLMLEGVPPRVVKQLCGHADISTTLGYMHLSRNSEESAIRLLDDRTREQTRGEIVESAGTRRENR